MPIWEEYDGGEVLESIEGSEEGFCGGRVGRDWNGYVEYEESRERWTLVKTLAGRKRAAGEEAEGEWKERKRGRNDPM